MFRRTLAVLQEVARSTASASSSSVDVLTSHLSRAHLPPVLARIQKPHKNLYQLLSSLPNDGVGAKVRQRRWAAKGLDIPRGQDLKTHIQHLQQSSTKETKTEGHLCYWEITKVKLKDGGNHGKAWGRLIWRGMSTHLLVSHKDTDLPLSPRGRYTNWHCKKFQAYPRRPQVLLGHRPLICAITHPAPSLINGRHTDGADKVSSVGHPRTTRLNLYHNYRHYAALKVDCCRPPSFCALTVPNPVYFCVTSPLQL